MEVSCEMRKLEIILVLVLVCVLVYVGVFTGRVVEGGFSNADINRDGSVNFGDVEIFSESYGDVGCEDRGWCGGSDINRDGVVDRADLEILSSEYGGVVNFSSGFGDGCLSDVQCGEWSECRVDYNFINLIDGKIEELKGARSRICRDLNSCLVPTEEVVECDIGVDVYARRVERCGVEFIEVYNELDDKLVARIEKVMGGEPHLNVYFDVEENVEC